MFPDPLEERERAVLQEYRDLRERGDTPERTEPRGRGERKVFWERVVGGDWLDQEVHQEPEGHVENLARKETGDFPEWTEPQELRESMVPLVPSEMLDLGGHRETKGLQERVVTSDLWV